LNKKLYVGNMSYDVTSDDLEKLFAAHGTVQSVQLIKDRDTGQSKGFAFIEMGSGSEANAAINALHGSDVKGRNLTVNEARPQPEGGGNRRPSGGPKRSGTGTQFGGGRRY
jgi:cold-inducible RNA-binding protein